VAEADEDDRYEGERERKENEEFHGDDREEVRCELPPPAMSVSWIFAIDSQSRLRGVPILSTDKAFVIETDDEDPSEALEGKIEYHNAYVMSSDHAIRVEGRTNGCIDQDIEEI